MKHKSTESKKIKASLIKAIICINQHGKPVPIITGHLFCSNVKHQNIKPDETIINWRVIKELTQLDLVYTDDDNSVRLTRSGKGISKNMINRPIVGYD